MPRAYRPSPNELERLLREEKEKRKRMRILQVREMSRQHAVRTRNSYKQEMVRQKNKFVDECMSELLEEKENTLNDMREKYNHILQHQGEAHELASEWLDPQWEKMASLEQAEVMAAERFRLALDEMREQRASAEEKASQTIRARKDALETERVRAKFVAGLPPPEPAPYEAALNELQGRPVTVCDRGAMNTTHIHKVPEHYAVQSVDPHSDAAAGPDAREKAVFEEERLASMRLRNVLSLEENVVKAQMRGREAIRREVVHQDYNTMINELNGLARSDLARRQRDFQRLPSRLFAVPHRAGLEARMDERTRERGFETAFAEQLAHKRSPQDSHEEDDDDSGGMPRGSPLKPTSPTKVRTSRRHRHSDNYFLDANGNNAPPSGQNNEAPKPFSPPESESALPKKGIGFQPDSKEVSLQRLYQRIRSQRDKWLEGDQPVEPRQPLPGKAAAIPGAVRAIDPSPFDGISSGEEEEEEEEEEMEQEEEDSEEVRSSMDSQERKRPPGQRPPMVDLEAVSRIRTEVVSKIRSHEQRWAQRTQGEEEKREKKASERQLTIDADVQKTVSDRERLDAEMRELDCRMAALKQRGRNPKTDDVQPEIDGKTRALPNDRTSRYRDATRRTQRRWEAAPIVVPSGHTLPTDHDGSVSERSENSIADVRAYQQRALARLASLTVSDASECDDASVLGAAFPAGVRSSAKNIEARLQKMEMDLENERRKQAVLRSYLRQKATDGVLQPADERPEDPIVEPRRLQSSRLHPPTSYQPVSNQSQYSSSGARDYPLTGSLNPFAEYLHDSPPVRLETTRNIGFGTDVQTPYVSEPQMPLSSENFRNPFENSSTEPKHSLVTYPPESLTARSDSRNPFLSSGSSAGANLVTPAGTGPSDSKNPFVSSVFRDSRNPFHSCSSAEVPRHGSMTPADLGERLRHDSRNPFLTSASTDVQMPTLGSIPENSRDPLKSSLETQCPTTVTEPKNQQVSCPPPVMAPKGSGDVLLESGDERSPRMGVFTDHEHSPAVLTLKQMIENARFKSAQGDADPMDDASPPCSNESLSEVVIEPGELSFETLPSVTSSLPPTAEGKMDDGAVDSDPERTPVGSPDRPDVFADPSRPLRPLSLPLELPLRFRSRPPPMRELELSRITEVDTPLSMSGVTTLPDSLAAVEEASRPAGEGATNAAEDDDRAAFLRQFLLQQKERLQESGPELEQSSLSQHTAAESDLSSTSGRYSKVGDMSTSNDFKVLPTLDVASEPASDTLDCLEGVSTFSLNMSSVHMSQQPCLTSTMTGELLQECWEEEEEAADVSITKTAEPESETAALARACASDETLSAVPAATSTTQDDASLAQLLTRSRQDLEEGATAQSGGSSLTQAPDLTSTAGGSPPISSAKVSASVASLSQHAITQSDAAGSTGGALGLTQVSAGDATSGRATTSATRNDLTQRTASTLTSGPAASLSQNPTSCFTSSEVLAPSVSLTQVLTSNFTSDGVTPSGDLTNDDGRALTQVSTAFGGSSKDRSKILSLEQELASTEPEDIPADEQCALTQYPVSSFMDLSQPLSQFHDLEDSKGGKEATSGNNYDDTLQALDFSLPSAEVAASRTGATSADKASPVADLALPVLSETANSSAKSASHSPSSIDRLIAHSRQLRQDNNSSLLRDGLLDNGLGLAGRPDLSLGSSATTNDVDRPLTQVETRLLSDTADTEFEPLHVDTDSLVSFMHHEQELCRDSLSTRGSSDSAGGASLQSAYAAHKARVAQLKSKPKRSEETKRKELKEGSVEEMQRTLASWKAERLQRRVSGKALLPKVNANPSPSCSAHSSSGGSCEGVGPTARVQERGRAEDDPCTRTRRLWQQLEEVKARAREEEVAKERQRNRERCREFNERMRMKRQARKEKSKP